jgi:hypothetical protein
MEPGTRGSVAHSSSVGNGPKRSSSESLLVEFKLGVLATGMGSTSEAPLVTSRLARVLVMAAMVEVQHGQRCRVDRSAALWMGARASVHIYPQIALVCSLGTVNTKILDRTRTPEGMRLSYLIIALIGGAALAQSPDSGDLV